ncbi:MAG: RlmE family RNA methyltransferase [Candidatus Nezhaarchaeales archaeon]
MAKKLGFRSRAAFKLLEINKKFGILKRGYVVLDVGAYPGGWLQVASKIVGSTGLVIGIDLRPISKMSAPNVKTVIGDVCDESLHDKLASMISRKIDVILSDAAPKLTGVWSTDIARHSHIIYCILKLANKLLRKGGTAVIKAFQGEELNELLMDIRSLFGDVRLFKPKASRQRSREVYLICTSFHGGNDINRDAA